MIEIVIKISDEDYKAIAKGYLPYGAIADAIKQGEPLPEHHGRLVDADELKTMSYEVFLDTDNPNRADGLSACNGLVEDDIDLAPTIIEGSDTE